MTNPTQQDTNTLTSANVDAQAMPHPTAEQVKKFVARVRAWFMPISTGLYRSELKSQITNLATCLAAVEDGLVAFDGTDDALRALEKLVLELLEAVDALDLALGSRSNRIKRKADDDYLPLRTEADELLKAFPVPAATPDDKAAPGSRIKTEI